MKNEIEMIRICLQLDGSVRYIPFANEEYSDYPLETKQALNLMAEGTKIEVAAPHPNLRDASLETISPIKMITI